MERPNASLLSGGTKLHLRHGPIDLVISAEPDRDAAFHAAHRRFTNILNELMREIDLLRMPFASGTRPDGPTARRMWQAARMAAPRFVTPMAAVAGAVADEVLAAILDAAAPRCAFVNNGGDIALRLAPDESFTIAMRDHRNRPLGEVSVAAGDGVGGIATSGRHGRSLSLGIADSVTVLAGSAAAADTAATLIANAVDLPGHPAIRRRPARELVPDSDLGARLVTTDVAPLGASEVEVALDRGAAEALRLAQSGAIAAAALFLDGGRRAIGRDQAFALSHPIRRRIPCPT